MKTIGDVVIDSILRGNLLYANLAFGEAIGKTEHGQDVIRCEEVQLAPRENAVEQINALICDFTRQVLPITAKDQEGQQWLVSDMFGSGFSRWPS